MVLDIGYDEVASAFGKDFVGEGLFARDVELYLATQGFGTLRIYRYWHLDVENQSARVARVWPPLPFVEKHIVEIRKGKGAPNHYVVMDGDGVVFDPLDVDHVRRSLGDYEFVNSVCGIMGRVDPIELVDD